MGSKYDQLDIDERFEIYRLHEARYHINSRLPGPTIKLFVVEVANNPPVEIANRQNTDIRCPF